MSNVAQLRQLIDSLLVPSITSNLEVSFMNLLLLLTCYFFNRACHAISILHYVFIMM